MANYRLEWRGPEVQRTVEAEMSRRMDVVAETLASQIRKNLSEPSRPPGRPSFPGEFPHTDTGKLRQSIHWKRTGELSRDVGSPLIYAAVHEYGGRSFIRRTFMELQDRLAKILTKVIPGLSGGKGR